jgi:hypothetical protein
LPSFPASNNNQKKNYLFIYLFFRPDGGRTGCPTRATRVPDGVAGRGARRGQTGCPTGARRSAQRGQTGCPMGWPDGAERGARRGLERVPDGVPDGVKRGPDGARRSARRAKRGGGRKDYLLLKEKMTCSVYVSCKSSSASDVSNAG